MNPYMAEESQAWYHERVDAAEQWRLAQLACAQSASRPQWVRIALAIGLIAWGRILSLYRVRGVNPGARHVCRTKA